MLATSLRAAVAVAVGSEVGEEVDRGRRAGQQLVGQRAQLEPLGHRRRWRAAACRAPASRAAPGRRRARRGAGRGTCRASRRRSPRRARPRRPGRAGSGARRRRRRGRRARAPRRRSPATSGRVPSRFDAPVTATSRVRSLSRSVTSLDGQLARGRVERRPAHGRTGDLRRAYPGPDVGVVVEPGHHDLVARPPTAWPARARCRR